MHGYGDPYTGAVLTNQCPWCRCIFLAPSRPRFMFVLGVSVVNVLVAHAFASLSYMILLHGTVHSVVFRSSHSLICKHTLFSICLIIASLRFFLAPARPMHLRMLHPRRFLHPMDSWTVATPDAKRAAPDPKFSNKASKQARAQPQRRLNNDREEPLTAVAKLSLQSATNLRSHIGILETTVILPESQLTAGLHRTGQEYFNQHQQGVQATTLRGPPYVHVWATLLLYFSTHDENKDRNAVFKQHIQEVTSASFLLGQVHTCRIAKACESGKHRIVLAVSDQLRPVLKAVLSALQDLGGEVKLGVPAKVAAGTPGPTTRELCSLGFRLLKSLRDLELSPCILILSTGSLCSLMCAPLHHHSFVKFVCLTLISQGTRTDGCHTF